MQEIGKFLVDNWKIILDVVLMAFSIVFFLVKKKPVVVVDEVRTHVLRSLVYLIKKAEKEFGAGHGEDKFDFVMDSLMETLHRCYPDIDPMTYYNFAEQYLEYILETPQKKGETRWPKEK